MPDNNPIYLSSLSGKQLEIAKIVNVVPDDCLVGDEVSVFLKKCNEEGVKYEPSWISTVYNKGCQLWDKGVNWVKHKILGREQTLQNSKEDMLAKNCEEKSKIDLSTYSMEKVVKKENNITKINKVYDNEKGQFGEAKIDIEIIQEKDGNTTVNYKRIQASRMNKFVQKSSFTFNKEDLENYIINRAVDKDGNTLKYFKDINNIRALPANEQTDKQKALLIEFDNLINSVINAGIDYGVDPKAILAIMQQESRFEPNHVSDGGKGYMQLTTSVPADILSAIKIPRHDVNRASFDKGLKLQVYGSEVLDLFKSRGFDLANAKTTEQKRELLNKIKDYLSKNEDYEFNIRLGTIKLRQVLNSSNGDFKEAALKYNAHESHKHAYSNITARNLNSISKNSYRDSMYYYAKDNSEIT